MLPIPLLVPVQDLARLGTLLTPAPATTHTLNPINSDASLSAETPTSSSLEHVPLIRQYITQRADERYRKVLEEAYDGE